jgi:hypothetical protein
MGIRQSQRIVPILFDSNISSYNDQCVICLSKIHENATVLPCGHVYHSDCILDHFEHKLNCPLCKTVFVWTRRI